MIDANTILDGSVLVPIGVVVAALTPPLAGFVWLNKRLGRIDAKLDRLDDNHITREMMLDWIMTLRDENETLKVPRFPGRQPPRDDA
jgi:hypothetical protein